MKRWFSPKLLGLHVTAVFLIALCLWLGRWQLGVYEFHQSTERADKSHIAAVPIDSIWGPNKYVTSDQVDRRVHVTGTFEPAAQQVWVSGKDNGYWLLAPASVHGRDLIVVRGWSPTAGTPPAVPAGKVSFDAVVQPSDDSGLTGYDSSTNTIGAVSIPELLNVVNQPLWSGYVIATTHDVAGGLKLAQVPPPDVSWTAGGVNLGYSLQWWAFVGFVIFMWWRMAREAISDSE